jgi:hypothetical protein
VLLQDRWVEAARNLSQLFDGVRESLRGARPLFRHNLLPRSLRPVPKAADIAANHGRGLVLVDALADAWGYRAAHGGKVVWCELATPPLSASTSAAS